MSTDHEPRRPNGRPDGENSHDSSRPGGSDVAAWWRALGLRDPDPGRSTNERVEARARWNRLVSLVPSGFVRHTGAGEESLSLAEVVAELGESADASARNARRASEERRAHGWARVRAALSSPDAGERIERGPWAGFTRGRTVAWSWNLFQYEPHGFVHPGSQARHESLAALENGELRDVFGYPARAAALERSGLTPEGYRSAQEALGKRIFDPADVITSA
ncbi:hypothetical protein [Microbacterium halophytorum]|uniref:hypothetical protein n=1 Tax=Microbacterium halophytorum TaxID=2067568 RepID=UPI000CFAEFE1|nr:hypothetical protein [Microbacterium halophytorum]